MKNSPISTDNNNNNSSTPPKWGERLLEWYCPQGAIEEVQGDLAELYKYWADNYGIREANSRYLYSVLRLMRPFNSGAKINSFLKASHIDMFKNFLTITLRNMVRQPLHALLNLFCLTIGIASTLLIVMYLDFELNYDRIHTKAERIYRIETVRVNLKQKVLDLDWHSTPNNFGAFVKQDYPQVENYVRIFKFFTNEQVQFEHDGKTIVEKEVYAADPSVFDVFSFDLLSGNVKQALHGPNKIVLSQSLASRLFGKANPIGKLITSKLAHNLPDMKENYSFMVTGVYRDLPNNTHLPLEAIISSATDVGQKDYYFGTYNTFTYLLLPAGINPETLAPKLTKIYDRYLDPSREPVMTNAIHELLPLTAIHVEETGGLTYIYIFAGIGTLLLLIATISYVNLVTAQASKRALEIGIRKVLGSRRRQLIMQFLSESIFFSLLALFLALLLVVAFLHPLNNLLDLHLWLAQLWHPGLLISMLLIIIAIGLLGGSYPAFFLSSFEPISVMKGKLAKGAPLRRVLVAMEFAVVIFVLTCTGMIYDQLSYMRKKDLGFDKEQVIKLSLEGENELQRWDALKERLLQSPHIVSAGTADFLPGADNIGEGPISADGTPDRTPQFARRGVVDYDFFPTLNIPILKGRNFSKDHPADLSKSVLVNEAFLKKFNLKGSVGERIRYGDKGNPSALEIIGIVSDFHQSTLHSPIEAQVFILKPSSLNLVVKASKDLDAALAHVEKSWQELIPERALEYTFLDEQVQSGYKADLIRGRLFLAFSLLTLLISFLGLFGLASYVAKGRIKEVSVRRVLGAEKANILLLLSKDFLLLVVLAALPAFALARYMIGKWLQNFAFRTDMNYPLFGSVLLFTLLLTFLTTGYHALQAMKHNPAQILKSE